MQNNNQENQNELLQQQIVTDQDDIRSILQGESNGASFKKREEIKKQAMMPSRDYEELNETSISNIKYTPTDRRRKKNRELTIWLIFVIILCCISCCFLVNVNKFFEPKKDLEKSETKYVDTTSISIDGTIVSYEMNENFIDIKITNQSSINVCYNVRGTYLSTSSETFSPIIEQTTNIPSQFFGGQIYTNEEYVGTLFFNTSCIQDSDYLILTDVLINNYSYDIVFSL